MDKNDGKTKKLQTDLSEILSGIIAKEEQEPKIFQKIKEHNEFKDLQKKDVWRLFIDHWQDSRGEYGFENESGYLSAMYKAFGNVLDSRHEKLSTRLLIRFHTAAVMKVKKDITAFNPRDAVFKQGFRDPKDRVAFSLILGRSATQDGLEDILESTQNSSEPKMFSIVWSCYDSVARKPMRDSNGVLLTDPDGIIGELITMQNTDPLWLRKYADTVINACSNQYGWFRD